MGRAVRASSHSRQGIFCRSLDTVRCHCKKESMTRTSTPPPQLTLADLTEALASLLAEGYRGSASGRVRDLPDARTVRWYQTTGLVDRPHEYRGRTALFGRRHLLQLAAIKTLQASGFPLAEIQQGIAGRTDAELSKAAGATVKAANAVIADIAQRTATANDERLRAAVTGTRPDQNEPTASRRKSSFWAVDAAGSGATAEQTGQQHEPDAVSTSAVQPQLQSLPLDDQVMVVWQGRPLTNKEQRRVRQLAGPLAEFLRSLEPTVSVAKKTRSASSPQGVFK